MENPKWYILTRALNGDGYCLFWKPERSGYTTNLYEAGRYTDAEADEIEDLRPPLDVRVHYSDAKAASVSVVPIGALQDCDVEEACGRLGSLWPVPGGHDVWRCDYHCPFKIHNV